MCKHHHCHSYHPKTLLCGSGVVSLKGARKSSSRANSNDIYNSSLVLKCSSPFTKWPRLLAFLLLPLPIIYNIYTKNTIFAKQQCLLMPSCLISLLEMPYLLNLLIHLVKLDSSFKSSSDASSLVNPSPTSYCRQISYTPSIPSYWSGDSIKSCIHKENVKGENFAHFSFPTQSFTKLSQSGTFI